MATRALPARAGAAAIAAASRHRVSTIPLKSLQCSSYSHSRGLSSSSSSHSTSALTRVWDGPSFPLSALVGTATGTVGGKRRSTAGRSTDLRNAAVDSFNEHGFLVVTDVMTPAENDAVIGALLDDLHEINPATARTHTSLSDFQEVELPTSPNHSFRTTCHLVFGRFASAVRSSDSVKSAFAALHGVPADKLGVSWDTIFFTSRAEEVNGSLATQLHWDHNGYCAGKRVALADDLCVQGVYYASPTDGSTPSFACSPGSHRVWPVFSESDINPAKQGDLLLNYLPLEPFAHGAGGMLKSLAPPVRVHVPARSLLLWNSRTAHGNAPPIRSSNVDQMEAGRLGRVSLAVCYGPVDKRGADTHKDALVKALGAVRTTHHPALMFSHDQQGYPRDWTAEAEYEPNQGLRKLHINLNPDVTEAEFQDMLANAAGLASEEKRLLAATMTLSTVVDRVYRSYWGISDDDGQIYRQMSALSLADLRKLIHPQYSSVQGRHLAET